MKAMLGVVKLFLCLVFPAFALQQEILNQDCPLYAGTTFFVNTSGVNSPNCGASSKPCYSTSYAVNLAVRKNVSSLTVNISTGKYEELESIKLDCGRWSLRKVTFWGERLVNRVIWFCVCVQWLFHVITYQPLCILIFSNFAYKKCCNLFFTFGFL